MSISKEEFVEVWCTFHREGKSLEDVAHHFNKSPNYVSSKASRFRQRGVNLPKFEHGAHRFDIDALNLVGVRFSSKPPSNDLGSLFPPNPEAMPAPAQEPMSLRWDDFEANPESAGDDVAGSGAESDLWDI